MSPTLGTFEWISYCTEMVKKMTDSVLRLDANEYVLYDKHQTVKENDMQCPTGNARFYGILTH